MTKRYHRLAPLLLSISTSGLLVSCVDPGYPGGGGHSSRNYGSSVYTTLPRTFTGNAYYHNGRYYSGGNYQTGRFHDRGRTHSNRYYHNGRYYYGGEYLQRSAKPGVQGPDGDYGRDQDPSRRRDISDSLRPFNRTRGQMPAVQSRYY